MKIVINHLTRMQKGFVCVAGIDLATGQHVRPVLRSALRKDLLARYGGPFDMGRLVDLGWTRYIGTRPETEDYMFHRTGNRTGRDSGRRPDTCVPGPTRRPTCALVAGEQSSLRERTPLAAGLSRDPYGT